MNHVCLSAKLSQNSHQGYPAKNGGSYLCLDGFSPEITLGWPEYKYDSVVDQVVARYYDATIGRFISSDTFVPSATNPQSWNRYSYCYNNPMVYIDPTGHFNFKKMLNDIGNAITDTANGVYDVVIDPVVDATVDFTKDAPAGLAGTADIITGGLWNEDSWEAFGRWMVPQDMENYVDQSWGPGGSTSDKILSTVGAITTGSLTGLTVAAPLTSSTVRTATSTTVKSVVNKGILGGADDVIPLTQKQLGQLPKFNKSIPNGSYPTEISQFGDDIMFTAHSPGREVGRYKVYQTTFDANGNRTSYYKMAYDSKGNLMNVKDAMDGDRIIIHTGYW